jgi:hypothetical protein
MKVQALAMTTPAEANDSVRIGARDVKQKYVILSCVAPSPAQFNNQQTTEDQALFDNISVGPETALFDNFQIIPNPYSQYVLPTMYAVAEQQSIINWDTMINFSFVGAGAHYMRTLTLRTMESRRMQVGDNIVFLYCSTIRFSPETPFATFDKVTHVWYIVVDVQNDMVYFDKKGLLLNVVQSYLLPLKMLEHIYNLIRRSHLICHYRYLLIKHQSDSPIGTVIVSIDCKDVHTLWSVYCLYSILLL